MRNADDFAARVELKISKLIEQHGPQSELSKEHEEDLRRLIAYLGILRKEYEEERSWIKRLDDPKVFVSYSGERGLEFLKRCMTAIRSAKGNPFQVLTGMGRDGRPLVTEHIVSKIGQCCLFVGILTNERELNSGQFVPGAWVHVEAGIALAFGLEVVLLYEDGIDEQCWKSIFGHSRHVEFTEKTLPSSLETLKAFLRERYEGLIQKYK